MMDEGYDSLENLRGLELNDLIEDIGMKKGHAKRLLREIQSIGSADSSKSLSPGESKTEASASTKEVSFVN